MKLKLKWTLQRGAVLVANIGPYLTYQVVPEENGWIPTRISTPEGYQMRSLQMEAMPLLKALKWCKEDFKTGTELLKEHLRTPHNKVDLSPVEVACIMWQWEFPTEGL